MIRVLDSNETGGVMKQHWLMISLRTVLMKVLDFEHRPEQSQMADVGGGRFKQ